MKILALHLHNIFEYAQMRGITRHDLMSRIENPPNNFMGETDTVSAEDFYRTLNYIDEQLQEEHLGIRLGNFLNLNALGLIYHISLQATTIEEALHYLQTYLNVTFPLIEIRSIVEPTAFRIILSITNEERKANKVILENVQTIIAKELSLMSAGKVSIIKTSPDYTDTYPTDWQVRDNHEIVFPPMILKATLQDFSRQQLDILIPEYLKLIEGLKSEPSFSNKVKMASLHLAKPKLLSLETIADAFHLSPRTFQRRLVNEQVTFRQINDDLKRQISGLLIRHNRFSVTDISYVLGYSEPAAFIHSFKKWFGDSPERLRQRIS